MSNSNTATVPTATSDSSSLAIGGVELRDRAASIKIPDFESPETSHETNGNGYTDLPDGSEITLCPTVFNASDARDSLG